MIKNYLKITFRTLLKYKGFSLINIFGLALGMAICLLIILLVRDQQRYDRFHPLADRIYRVVSTTVNATGGAFRMATSPGPMGPLLVDDYPMVTDVVRLHQTHDGHLVRSGFFDRRFHRKTRGDLPEGPVPGYLCAVRAFLKDRRPGRGHDVALPDVIYISCHVPHAVCVNAAEVRQDQVLRLFESLA